MELERLFGAGALAAGAPAATPAPAAPVPEAVPEPVGAAA
jgi:hypothetical protein